MAFGVQPSPEREALWAAWAARLPQHTFTTLQGRRGLPQPLPLPQPVCRQWAASSQLHLLPATAGVGAVRRSRGSLSQLTDKPASQAPWNHAREVREKIAPLRCQRSGINIAEPHSCMPHPHTCSSETGSQAPSQRSLRNFDISCARPPHGSKLQRTPIVNHCFGLISTAEMFCMARA